MICFGIFRSGFTHHNVATKTFRFLEKNVRNLFCGRVTFNFQINISSWSIVMKYSWRQCNLLAILARMRAYIIPVLYGNGGWANEFLTTYGSIFMERIRERAVCKSYNNAVLLLNSKITIRCRRKGICTQCKFYVFCDFICCPTLFSIGF